MWELLPLHFLSQFSFQPNHKELLLSQSFFFFFFPLFSTSPLFEMSVTNKIKYLFFLFQNFLFPGCGHSVSLCSSFQGKNFAPSRWILAGVWIWVPILPLQPSQGGSLFYLFLGKSHSRGIPSLNCIFSVPATKGRELMFSPHSGSSPCWNPNKPWWKFRNFVIRKDAAQ